METGVTPLCGLLGERRMENGEWQLPFSRPHVVRMYALFTCIFPSRGERGEKRWEAVSSSPRILHSSSPEERKLGFSFSENGPSAIQGHGATSPFTDLGEWEERGVTTPNVRAWYGLDYCSPSLVWQVWKTQKKLYYQGVVFSLIWQMV